MNLPCILFPLSFRVSFADRGFHEDWVNDHWVDLPHSLTLMLVFQWNSTSWNEFSRKWNKPVHNFLMRHVLYASAITNVPVFAISRHVCHLPSIRRSP